MCYDQGRILEGTQQPRTFTDEPKAQVGQRSNKILFLKSKCCIFKTDYSLQHQNTKSARVTKVGEAANQVTVCVYRTWILLPGHISLSQFWEWSQLKALLCESPARIQSTPDVTEEHTRCWGKISDCLLCFYQHICSIWITRVMSELTLQKTYQRFILCRLRWNAGLDCGLVWRPSWPENVMFLSVILLQGWLFFFHPRWGGTNCAAPVLHSCQDVRGLQLRGCWGHRAHMKTVLYWVFFFFVCLLLSLKPLLI